MRCGPRRVTEEVGRPSTLGSLQGGLAKLRGSQSPWCGCWRAGVQAMPRHAHKAARHLLGPQRPRTKVLGVGGGIWQQSF